MNMQFITHGIIQESRLAVSALNVGVITPRMKVLKKGTHAIVHTHLSDNFGYGYSPWLVMFATGTPHFTQITALSLISAPQFVQNMIYSS